MKLSSLMIFIFFFYLTVWSQTATEKKWIRVETENKDFSILLPDGFLSDVEKDFTGLHGFHKNVSISLRIEKYKDPKKHFKEIFSNLTSQEFPKYKFYNSGDFICAEYSAKPENNLPTFNVTLASSKGFYSIYITNGDLNNDIYSKVISSMRLYGNILYSTKLESLQESEVWQISSLQTSNEVIKALKQMESLQKKVESASNAEIQIPLETTGFSRSLIILRKPRASYTDSARINQVQGTVKLLVNFLANGQVGEIKLVSKLDNGLDQEAFSAAKKIKFVSAEKEGKPVDVKRFLEYNFSLY